LDLACISGLNQMSGVLGQRRTPDRRLLPFDGAQFRVSDHQKNH
jgi:hypothetical protein